MWCPTTRSAAVAFINALPVELHPDVVRAAGLEPATVDPRSNRCLHFGHPLKFCPPDNGVASALLLAKEVAGACTSGVALLSLALACSIC